jgi:hypothetical protein
MSRITASSTPPYCGSGISSVIRSVTLAPDLKLSRADIRPGRGSQPLGDPSTAGGSNLGGLLSALRRLGGTGFVSLGERLGWLMPDDEPMPWVGLAMATGDLMEMTGLSVVIVTGLIVIDHLGEQLDRPSGVGRTGPADHRAFVHHDGNSCIVI